MKASKVHGNKIIVSDMQKAFIRDNFLTMPLSDVVKATGLSTTRVRSEAYEMGIRNFSMQRWTDEQEEFLEFVYPYIGDVELAEIFQRMWPREKPWIKKNIDKKRMLKGWIRTEEMRKTVVKRNLMRGLYAVCNAKRWAGAPINPVGTVVVWTINGRDVAFVKTETEYTPRNRWLWEQYYGPVPDGMMVYCPDDAPVVCDISDLSLKTKAEIVDIVRYSDAVILKRQLKVRDRALQQEYIEKHPEVIELARAVLKVNGALRRAKKKSDGNN